MVNPVRRSPGGKEDGAHSSFENHCFHSNFWVFITLQLLRPAGALVRNHTLVVDSRVKMEAGSWNESESFVFVANLPL